MSLKLYMDENVQRAITDGLRRRNIDVLTVQEDQNAGLGDPHVLDRAGELGRVLFTNDTDFLDEAIRRQRRSESFPGVLYASQSAPVRRCIEDLELIAGVCNPEEYSGRIAYLPLK